MYLHFFIYVLLLNFTLSEALFLWKDKSIFFCFKVCPLYCSRRRRRDVDSASFISDEDWFPTFSPEFWAEDFQSHALPYHSHIHWIFKPTPKSMSTTPMTTTTTSPAPTPEPTFICVVCEKKCGFPVMKPSR